MAAIIDTDATSYDSGARRQTPLAQQLKRRIKDGGSISVADYMDSCLNDSAHGYYRHQTAIGADGDFITAPEITQVFGELLGLWAAAYWQQIGAPKCVNLIELGPGRGTMMRDMLRAAAVLPAFGNALNVHLVEQSETLETLQRQTLADSSRDICWCKDLEEIPAQPTILIANEFLDTVIINQMVKGEHGWRQRGVGLDDQSELAFTTMAPDDLPLAAALEQTATVGEIQESQNFTRISRSLAQLAQQAPLATLFIDYGYTGPEPGDTLQAVRKHRHEHPLTSPGEADLTGYVDWSAFISQTCDVAKDQGIDLNAEGPVPQAEFLGRLGIAERSARLMASNPKRAGEIELATQRLMAPQGMGTRFQVLGIRSSGLPPMPGFSS